MAATASLTERWLVRRYHYRARPRHTMTDRSNRDDRPNPPTNWLGYLAFDAGQTTRQDLRLAYAGT
jgi:hypothetical protein